MIKNKGDIVVNYIAEITNELYRYFDMFNEKFFNKELKQPMITIQRARSNNYGHFTLNPIWQNKIEDDDNLFEINLAAHQLHRNVVDIASTVLHEMCHYDNKIKGIKDCSPVVHNKKFKSKAELVGFIVEKSKSYGWAHTFPNDELKDFIVNEIKPKEEIFKYARIVTSVSPKEKKKSQYKFICPQCQAVAKAKQDVKLNCANCNVEMEMEDE